MATYYIDYQNGLDSNNGTSPATPVKNWNAANIGGTALAPGDVRLFKSGVVCIPSFRLQFTLSGTPTEALPVRFGTYGGDARAIIDGIGLRDTCIYPPDNNAGTPGRYVIVENLEIRNFTSAAFYNTGTASSFGGHIIRNCYIHHISGTSAAAIKTRGTDCRVEFNEVHDCGGDAIFVEGARQYVGHNKIRRSGLAQTIIGDDCIQAGTDSPDSIVEYNYCEKSENEWKQAILWLGSNSHVRYNTCIGPSDGAGLIVLSTGTNMKAYGNFCLGQDGIYFFSPSGACYAYGNILICNDIESTDTDASGIDSNGTGNTYYNNTIIGFRRGIHGQGHTIRNNIIINCTSAGIYAGTGVTAETDNCLYNNTMNIMDNLSAAVTPNASDILENPNLDSNYSPRNTNLRAAGYAGLGGKDYYRRDFKAAPIIGAVEYYAARTQTQRKVLAVSRRVN